MTSIDAGILAERLPALQRFADGRPDLVTRSLLDPLHVPCPELPGGIQQRAIDGLELCQGSLI